MYVGEIVKLLVCPFHTGDQDIYQTEDGSVGFQKVSAPLGVSWHNMGLGTASIETVDIDMHRSFGPRT